MTLYDRAASLWARVPPGTRTKLLRLANHKVMLGVVGLVDDGEGRVLVLEHRFRPACPWGLPGGYLAAGEALAPALARELMEETGLEIEVDPTPRGVEHRVGPATLSVALYARARSTTLRLSPEIIRGAFLSPDAVPADVYPWHAELIRQRFARPTREDPA